MYWGKRSPLLLICPTRSRTGRLVSLALSMAEEKSLALSISRPLTSRIRLPGTIPEVAAVGTVYPLPLFGRRVSTTAYVEGAPIPGVSVKNPLVELRFVSPGYFEAAGLHLDAGRFVEESDTADSPAVVVVNESFVRLLCPPGEAVGRRTTG